MVHIQWQSQPIHILYVIGSIKEEWESFIQGEVLTNLFDNFNLDFETMKENRGKIGGKNNTKTDRYSF